MVNRNVLRSSWLEVRSAYVLYPIVDEGALGKTNLLQGASMVKWTTLDPCSCLSESDPKLYTNFEFYEIGIHKHLENI